MDAPHRTIHRHPPNMQTKQLYVYAAERAATTQNVNYFQIKFIPKVKFIRICASFGVPRNLFRFPVLLCAGVWWAAFFFIFRFHFASFICINFSCARQFAVYKSSYEWSMSKWEKAPHRHRQRGSWQETLPGAANFFLVEFWICQFPVGLGSHKVMLFLWARPISWASQLPFDEGMRLYSSTHKGAGIRLSQNEFHTYSMHTWDTHTQPTVRWACTSILPNIHKKHITAEGGTARHRRRCFQSFRQRLSDA